jgi:hypothetical protein
VAASTHKPTEADIVAARISADQARTEANAEYQRCLDQHDQPGAPGATPEPTPGATPEPVPSPLGPGGKPAYPPGFDCHQIIAHMPTEQDYLPASFNLAQVSPDMFRALGAMLAMFGFMVGASFIGAEWSSGGVMTLLLWRPRRVPVWLGKLTSLLLGVLGVSAILSVLWYATLWLLSSHAGSTAMTTDELRSLAYTDFRAVALALAATVLGYSISALGRNTSTALGVAVGWVVVFEVGARITLGILEIHRPERWLLSTYVTAWLSKTVTLYDYASCRENSSQICNPVEWTVTMQQAALVGAALLVIVGGLSLVAFQRRDVT